MTETGKGQMPDAGISDHTAMPRADFVEPAHSPTIGVSAVERLPLGSALLVVTRGPNTGSRFRLDRPVTSAGRHPSSDIFLDDPTVSRKHAEFQWVNDDELCVVDLDSLNGTYVNHKQVDSTVLANGDEVQLGNFRLMFLAGRGK